MNEEKLYDSTVCVYNNYRTKVLYAISMLAFVLALFVDFMTFSDLSLFLTDYSSKIAALFLLFILFMMGNILFVCMLWLSGRYIVQIDLVHPEIIQINTWSIIGLHASKTYPMAILEQSEFHQGYLRFAEAHTVNVPWFRLQTPKGKLLIMDLRGDIRNELKAILLKTKTY